MDSRYTMSISLNVLNHLGVNLYSNIPAVLAEVIANAWDADATEVKVEFDRKNKAITISDNGLGMSLTDINEKYLHVGYQKRTDLNLTNGLTSKGRKPMGRKGIGKLSLFSIANKICVYSKRQGESEESFLMDTKEIKKAIQKENPSSSQDYKPEPIPFNVDISAHGTVIKIEELKKFRLTLAAETGLRTRIARRFGITPENDEFNILINGTAITLADRDYFHKARFLFQYGDYDYAQHCNNLDTEDTTGDKLSFARPFCFTTEGQESERGKYKVSGWIAIARHANDLDSGKKNSDAENDNLNKITIVVRGKVAQEDILQEYRIGGLITKYMYGEINADFLDEDDEEDITTSSRQKISEDDERYRALKEFIGNELRHIWNATNKLKEKHGLNMAQRANPYISEWYSKLKSESLQNFAMKIFSDIDKAGIDESRKQEFYAMGVTAFEALRMNDALAELEKINEKNLEVFLKYLSDLDNIEAMRYYEIVQERLTIIKKLRDNVDENAMEKVLQEYIFDHLWLLDPAWERATRYAKKEESIQAAANQTCREREKRYRIDIRYQRVMGAHVIVELKRANRRLAKTDIEKQVRQYIDAVKQELLETGNKNNLPIETVCIVGKLPLGWEKQETKKADENSLRPYSIRIITYKELIDNAWSAYEKFVQESESVGELKKLTDDIRNYKPKSEGEQ